MIGLAQGRTQFVHLPLQPDILPRQVLIDLFQADKGHHVGILAVNACYYLIGRRKPNAPLELIEMKQQSATNDFQYNEQKPIVILLEELQ